MAINDVSLTAGMRSNLVALQGTVDLLNRTQERLSTGKKVNTALDNPLNFFTAKALNSRAADLAGYKDGMSEAVQTIKAANAASPALKVCSPRQRQLPPRRRQAWKGAPALTLTSRSTLPLSRTARPSRVGTQTFTAVGTDMQRTITFAALTDGRCHHGR